MTLNLKLGLLGLLACATILQPTDALAQRGGVGGGGGHEIALEFGAILNTAMTKIKTLDSAMFTRLQKYNLPQILAGANIVVVDENLNVDIDKNQVQKSIVMNYPETQSLEINSFRWTRLKNAALREAIVLHEVLSLIRIEKTGSYPFSLPYLQKQNISTAEFLNIYTEKTPETIKKILTLTTDAYVNLQKIPYYNVIPYLANTLSLANAHTLSLNYLLKSQQDTPVLSYQEKAQIYEKLNYLHEAMIGTYQGPGIDRVSNPEAIRLAKAADINFIEALSLMTELLTTK